jgi:hypothetical protein
MVPDDGFGSRPAYALNCGDGSLTSSNGHFAQLCWSLSTVAAGTPAMLLESK